MKKFVGSIFLTLALFGATVEAQSRTIVNNPNAKRMLLGNHRLSLQWISWDYFGTAAVTDRKGVLYLKGTQRGRGHTDYVRVDGVITEINAKDFKFDGVIEIQISHNNGGVPCQRTGEMTFAITKNRKYWRLREMDNPCDGVTDYVDIYFR